MTQLIYFTDCYISRFDAEVVGLAGNRLILNRTAFYPEGGGQPSDTGTIRSPRGTSKVVSCTKKGDDVHHFLEGPLPRAGDGVQGAIDWGRRYAHMRYHTAQHLLSAHFLDRYGAITLGNRICAERAEMDFDLASFTPDMVDEAEARVKGWISEGFPVSIRLMPRHEAMQVLDSRRTRIDLLPKAVSVLRIVSVEGIDTVACAGTHVRNTSEIGSLHIVDTRSAGKDRTKLEFVLGGDSDS